MQNNYIEAAIYFTKAIETKSDEAYYYLHRGDCYETLGFVELAVADYRMFKKLKPDYMIQLRQ